jgi:hypothetical protein
MSNWPKAVWLAIAAVILALVIIIGGPKACDAIRSRDAQIKVDGSQRGALVNSIEDTLNTVSDVNTNTVISGDVSRQNEGDIRNAKGANQAVDPAANAAGLRALCRRPSHRNDPACPVP